MKTKGTVKENKDLVIRLADEGALSLEEIGALFDPPVTRQYIGLCLQEWEVQKQRKRLYRTHRSKVPITRKALVNLYYTENKSVKTIAGMCGVNPSIIDDRMREYGIPRRNLSDAITLSRGNTRKVHSIPRPRCGPWKYILYKDARYPFDNTEIKGRVRIEVVGNRLRAFRSEDGMLLMEWKLKKGKGRYKKLRKKLDNSIDKNRK